MYIECATQLQYGRPRLYTFRHGDAIVAYIKILLKRSERYCVVKTIAKTEQR